MSNAGYRPGSTQPQATTVEEKNRGSESVHAVQLKGKGYSEQRAALTPHSGDFLAQQQALAPVQMKGGDGSDDIHSAAVRGTNGSGGTLPHLEEIQASFGRHDISDIQSYTGGAAATASKSMGAA